jgi:hypothetical protein
VNSYLCVYFMIYLFFVFVGVILLGSRISLVFSFYLCICSIFFFFYAALGELFLWFLVWVKYMLSVVYFIYSLTSFLFKFLAHFCFVYITELCDRVMCNIIELFLFNWFPDSFVVALHLFLLIYLVFLLCSLSVVMVWVVWSCPLSVVVVLVVWSLEYCTFSSSFFSIFSYGFFDFSFACSWSG